MWIPDRLDFRIIRELAGSPARWNIKQSYTAVAKRLRVDEETIRNRLRRMKQEGYLLGWRLIPNPGIIDRKASVLLIEFGDSQARAKAMAQLPRTDGAIVVASFFEKRVSVTLFHEYDDEQFPLKAEYLASSNVGKLVTTWQMEFPPCNEGLTRMDWEIMWAMMQNPGRGLSSIAQDLKISTRTVKRRSDKMLHSYAFFFLPIVNLKKIGGVPCQFIVECEASQKTGVDKLINAKLDPILNFRDTGSNTHLVYGIACAKVTEGVEILKWIEKQSGVRTAWLNIVEQPLHVHGWLEQVVRDKALSTAKWSE